MRPLRIVLLVVVAVAVTYFAGISPRLRAQRELAARVQAGGRLRVRTAVAAVGTHDSELVLPANLQPFADTAIHARTTGYVAEWFVDLGQTVKAGQTLARIDSPEVDQELNQARARLQQSKANLELARVSADRWKKLAAQNAVPQQEADTRAAEFAARQADLAAATAEVQRLEQLQRFETVTAPFAGTVSARSIDVGNLVGPSGGPELFHLTQSRIMRVFVDVPQSSVGQIRVGLPVTVTVPEFAPRRFSGRVARFASALDAASRTLRAEIELPNDDGRLLAGMYGEVHLQIAPSGTILLIPSNDLIVRAEGTFVAEVAPDRILRLRHIRLGRDFGTQVEVIEGLAAGARIVENPSDALADGMEVEY